MKRVFLIGTLVMWAMTGLESLADPGRADSVAVWGWPPDVTTVSRGAQSGVIAIAGGGEHTLALRSDGSVVGWGVADQGQIEIPLAAQQNVIAISAGYSHSVALWSDGSVVAWGGRNDGESTVPPTAHSNVTAIAAGSTFTVALKSNGSVIVWGWMPDGVGVPIEAQSGVTAIAAGHQHILALKADGSVIAWGQNFHGSTTAPTSARSGVIAISAGAGHSLALKNDGSILAWGDNGSGQCNIPEGAQSGVKAIAAGASHSLALKTDGTVVTCGRNDLGLLVIPEAARSGVGAISAGWNHSVALVRAAAPVISSQPATQQTIDVGEDATLNVGAVGYPLNYQWLKNGVEIDGATGQTLKLARVYPKDGGIYAVRVSNHLGTVTSSNAVLAVNTETAYTTHSYRTLAQCVRPSGIALDGAGNIFAIEFTYNRIRKIEPNGASTIFAGAPEGTEREASRGFANGRGTEARFNFSTYAYSKLGGGMSSDRHGNLFVADTVNRVIRKIEPDGQVTTFAGAPGVDGDVDGTAGEARFGGPTALAVDDGGSIYVADFLRIRKIAPDGTTTTVHNYGDYGLCGIAVNKAGVIYAAYNATIQKITPDGIVTTLAGAPGEFGALDGLGSAARFAVGYGWSDPFAPLAVGPDGVIYLCDTYNSSIRRITPEGMVRTIAGAEIFHWFDGEGCDLDRPLCRAWPADGYVDAIGLDARFSGPGALAINGEGDLFIADTYNSRIRVGTAMPFLNMKNANNQVRFSWPATAGDYKLQSNAAIGSREWTDSTSERMLVNGRFTATEEIDSPAKTYRLRR